MKKPLLLDGAMGTELIERGLKLPLPLWSADANLFYPEIVTKIHQDYIDAGSEIITTNTFRTTSWTYRKFGYSKAKAKLKASESLNRAIECAQKSKGYIRIAGSITTINDCYKPEMYPGDTIAYDHYSEIINQMINNGLDLLLFETMGNSDEIKVILNILENYSIETWFSLIFRDKNYLLDGSSLNEVINNIKEKKVDILLNNCNKINSDLSGINFLKNKWENKWGVYPNLGITNFSNDYFEKVDNYTFFNKVKSILKMEPNVIGLCCGASIKDIKRLKRILEEFQYES